VRRLIEPSLGRGACAATLLAAAILLTAGCGYIGGPLTPLANVPTKISDLAAVERGALLIVHATVPARTTENVLIKTPVKLDLRIGVAGEHFNAEEWASQAKAISEVQVKDGIATYRISTREWVGKEVVLGVRAIGSNGKESGWSNYEIVPVVAEPEVPSRPDVEDTAAGERVTWTGRGDQFRVLRKTGGEESYIVAATVAAHEWIDTGIEYGKTYTYMMQALVDVGNQKVAESDLSETRPVTPLDKFPPAVPSGLRADPTPNSVALVWEGDTEPDLAGYRVYRSVGDGPWQKLADVNAVPSYSDTSVEHGKTYHYAIGAFDKTGNESARSTPVEIVP
jgi:hypothetical protein